MCRMMASLSRGDFLFSSARYLGMLTVWDHLDGQMIRCFFLRLSFPRAISSPNPVGIVVQIDLNQVTRQRKNQGVRAVQTRGLKRRASVSLRGRRGGQRFCKNKKSMIFSFQINKIQTEVLYICRSIIYVQKYIYAIYIMYMYIYAVVPRYLVGRRN